MLIVLVSAARPDETPANDSNATIAMAARTTFGDWLKTGDVLNKRPPPRDNENNPLLFIDESATLLVCYIRPSVVLRECIRTGWSRQPNYRVNLIYSLKLGEGSWTVGGG